MNLLDIVLSTITVYLGMGTLIGIAFFGKGAGRIDPAAEAASVGFRVLILPGSIMLWPIVLMKWIRA